MAKTHERRTERATAEEITEVERQLWEFAKRIDPPAVTEAKLRPGAFLYRVHHAWHSLGRGTGGLASRSFRALRDELLKHDPPVRNLQPKLDCKTALSLADAEQLIAVMLESWHLERNRNGKWSAKPFVQLDGGKPASRQDRDLIRDHLVHTLFRGDDHLLLEIPIGVPPETFFEDRGRDSLGLIIATSPETIVRLSPSNAQAGFSELVGRFFRAASDRDKKPLLIWIYRLPSIRDTAEFHQAYHALSVHSAAITNWYLRLSRLRGNARAEAQLLWKAVIENCAFAIYGLPAWFDNHSKISMWEEHPIAIDEDLQGIDPEFFLPPNLPVKFAHHAHVRRDPEYSYGMMMEITELQDEDIRYWLFPERARGSLDETAETTGLPAFETDMSPGADYDRAYNALYQATCCKFGYDRSDECRMKLTTLSRMGWTIFSIKELQEDLNAGTLLRKIN